jgi:ABC-type antimicrobial peptide transport system permease subunit
MAPMLKAALWAVPLAIVMSVAVDSICAFFELGAYKPANGWTALFVGGLWYVFYRRFQVRE